MCSTLGGKHRREKFNGPRAWTRGRRQTLDSTFLSKKPLLQKVQRELRWLSHEQREHSASTCLHIELGSRGNVPASSPLNLETMQPHREQREKHIMQLQPEVPQVGLFQPGECEGRHTGHGRHCRTYHLSFSSEWLKRGDRETRLSGHVTDRTHLWLTTSAHVTA